MKRTFVSLGLVILFLSAEYLSASISPQEAARNIEKNLASLSSLQAEFEQSYFSASLATPLLEKGKLFLEKPDRMRWEYQEPERNIYVYKEGVSLAYFPEDNQLFRHTLSPEEKDWAVFSLLTGRARLIETYTIEAAEFPTDKKTSVQLKLIPLEEGELSYILIETDPRTWLLERAIFLDWAGNKQEFRFSGFKLNPRFDARIFELEVPPDCEIIDDLPPEKNR
ncbi:MAG: outer membrane lipoprotein carrier protein LolA [Candidatus Aminicenantales bacterium]